MNEEKHLIKDLFIAFQDAYTDRGEKGGKKVVCTHCFSFTETGEKIEHAEDCAVAIMRARVKKIMEKQ